TGSSTARSWKTTRSRRPISHRSLPHCWRRHPPEGTDPKNERGGRRAGGERSAMAVKVIVELKAKPGRRDELRSLIEQLAARDRPSDYHGSTYFESLDDPDLLIDIADWESPGAR